MKQAGGPEEVQWGNTIDRNNKFDIQTNMQKYGRTTKTIGLLNAVSILWAMPSEETNKSFFPEIMQFSC